MPSIVTIASCPYACKLYIGYAYYRYTNLYFQLYFSYSPYKKIGYVTCFIRGIWGHFTRTGTP